MRLLDVKTRQPKRSEPVHLFVLGDVHVGNRNADLDHFLRDVDAIRKTPNAYCILMGDLVDAIAISDKRFDRREVDPQFHGWLDQLPQREVRWICDALKPIKDRILCILTGNHEETVRDVTTRVGVAYDPHYEICKYLGARSLDYCGFVRWKISASDNDNKSRGTVNNDVITIYATHGHGSGQTPGSHAQAITRLMDGFEADLTFFAHRHQRFVWQRVRLAAARRGTLALVERKTTGAMPGSYLKTATPGHPGYAARKGLHPTPIGCLEFVIRRLWAEPTIEAITRA
jgi:UDP-2,3-diacylglucosamine pyrophosphatase LpxH